MEYIEKRGNIYYAMQGDVKIDNINTFQSRRNFHGAGGSKVYFTINDFSIQWRTNFGYGSWSFGYVEAKYKGMEVRQYDDIETTKSFVDILNKYVCIQDEEKDEIIVELANVIAHCINEIDDNSTSIYTSIPIEELKKKSITNIYFQIKKMKERINDLEKEIEELNK